MRNNQPVTQQEYLLPDGMTIVSRTDPKGRISYINEDFLVASGFSEAELMGQAHNIVRHPDMPEEAFADLWVAMKAGRPWTGVVKNRRKNGDHYWVVANVTPLREGNQVVGYMSVRTRPTREQVQASEEAYRRFRDGSARGLAIRDGGVVRLGPMLSLRDALDGIGLGGWTFLLALLCLLAGGAAGAWASGGFTGLALPLAAGALLALALWIGVARNARMGRLLKQATEHLEQFAQARFDGIVPVDGRDALATLMESLRRVQTRLGFEFADTKRRAEESERIRQALDAAATNVMVADAGYNIVYGNASLQQMLQAAEADLRKDLPAFQASSVVGANIDQFHKNPAHQRLLLDRLQGVHRTRLHIGGRRFDLIVNPVNVAGKRIGTVVEWKDMTAELAAREREEAAAAENARIRQALDVNASPVRIADADGKIVYANQALLNPARQRGRHHPRGARRRRPARLRLPRCRRPRRALSPLGQPAGRQRGRDHRLAAGDQRVGQAERRQRHTSPTASPPRPPARRQRRRPGRGPDRGRDEVHRHQDRHHRRHRLPDQPAGAERRHRGRPRRRTRQGLRRGGRRGAQAGRAQPGRGAGDRHPGRRQRAAWPSAPAAAAAHGAQHPEDQRAGAGDRRRQRRAEPGVWPDHRRHEPPLSTTQQTASASEQLSATAEELSAQAGSCRT
jgi:PAS domain S-box-containing protein